jgi:hypothetical protein
MPAILFIEQMKIPNIATVVSGRMVIIFCSLGILETLIKLLLSALVFLKLSSLGFLLPPSYLLDLFVQFFTIMLNFVGFELLVIRLGGQSNHLGLSFGIVARLNWYIVLITNKSDGHVFIFIFLFTSPIILL